MIRHCDFAVGNKYSTHSLSILWCIPLTNIRIHIKYRTRVQNNGTMACADNQFLFLNFYDYIKYYQSLNGKFDFSL